MSKGLVLVDSSIWVECLRKGHSGNREHFDYLLAEDRVAICGPVKAEVLSGANSLDDYQKLSKSLGGIHFLHIPEEEVWDRVAELRYKLAKKGIQQKLVDLLIAVIAQEFNVRVWSLDDDFMVIAKEMPLKLYSFAK